MVGANVRMGQDKTFFKSKLPPMSFRITDYESLFPAELADEYLICQRTIEAGSRYPGENSVYIRTTKFKLEAIGALAITRVGQTEWEELLRSKKEFSEKELRTDPMEYGGAA